MTLLETGALTFMIEVSKTYRTALKHLTRNSSSQSVTKAHIKRYQSKDWQKLLNDTGF